MKSSVVEGVWELFERDEREWRVFLTIVFLILWDLR